MSKRLQIAALFWMMACWTIHPRAVLASGNAGVIEARPSGSGLAGGVGCRMGIFTPPENIYSPELGGWIDPDGERHYTLLTSGWPADCPPCTGGFRLNMAHAWLYFSMPCEYSVTVWLVAAVEDQNGCLRPDPSGASLCTPIDYQISNTFVHDCVQIDIPVPADCCINTPAFLVIQFNQGQCPTFSTYFCGPHGCEHCVQYREKPLNAPLTDICDSHLIAYGMWVDAECCEPTPTLPGTWGRLKTIYR